MNKTQEEIENCLFSDLNNLISEFNNNELTENDIYGYFRLILCDADVKPEIIVNVLENECFGKLGKNEALNIKRSEGW